MIFDTHAHYDDEAFDLDREQLLFDIKNSNIKYVTNIASDFKSIDSVLSLTKKYDFIFGALGIHPSDSGEMNEENFSYIENKLSEDKIVAVGEIGLDYYYDTPDPAIQKKWFSYQINMAKRKNIPLVIHSREAAKDTYDIMKAENADAAGGVIHCYSYSVEMAKNFLDMGFYIGVGGVVTFKNSQKLKEVVKYTPLDRIVTETDCPYLSPVPFRGKRNSSNNIPYIIEQIASLKELSIEETENALFENALNLYNLKGLLCQN